MRVLLISDSYPPLIGGATRSTQQLGRQLALRRHEVTVATVWQRGLPAREDDDGVRVHRLRGLVSRVPWLSADPVRYTPPPFPDPELVWRLRRLLRRSRPDVVQSYGWMTYSCVVALWGTGIPLVLSIRDHGHLCAVRTLVRRGEPCNGPAPVKCLGCAARSYGAPKGAASVAAVLGLRRLLRSRVDALHSTSRFARDVTWRHLLGGAAVPDAVIPDFREDELTGPPDEELLSRLPAEPYILYVGALRRIKGIALLLEAYGRLEEPPPLVMIGARTAEAVPAAPPGVTFLFDVPHDTVMAAWDRAIFGVSPSLAPEGLGNVVHEGMSRGRPVIGTRPGGHEDIVDDGVDGLLVPAGDVDALLGAMRRLLDDASLRERLGAAARQKATRFTPERVLPELDALWRTALERRSRPLPR